MQNVPCEIVVEVTYQCNLDCSFCFNRNSLDNGNNCFEQISTTSIRHIVDQTVNIGIPAIRFTGGEPLLRGDIYSLLSYAKERGLYVMLNTNGTLIDDEKVREIERFVDNVLVPLNSYDNEVSEKLTGKQNCLDIRLKALSKLKQSRIPIVRSGTVASKDTIRNLRKIFSLVKGLSLDAWEVYRQVGTERGVGPLDRKDIRILVEKLLRFKNMGFYVPIANALPFCAYDPRKTSEVSLGAMYDDGNSRLVIDPRGHAKPSYFVNEHIGTCTDIMGAWNHPFLSDIMRKPPEGCVRCPYVSRCKGGSRYASFLANGNYLDEDPLTNRKNLFGEESSQPYRVEGGRGIYSSRKSLQQSQSGGENPAVRKKVLIYCQSCYGIGHFIISLTVAQQVAKFHDVLLVYGGKRYGIQIPQNLRFLQLPEITDNPDDRRRIQCMDGDLEAVKRQRTQKLLEATNVFAPDIVMVEQFPFGRSNFLFEISPFIRHLYQAKVPLYCLKAVISAIQRGDDHLRYISFFDKVLVCTDPCIELLDEEVQTDSFRDKVEYCGYVVDEGKLRDTSHLRQKLHLEDERLITACVGGGIEGSRRLRCVIQAIHLMEENIRLIVFTGPQMPQEEIDTLRHYIQGDRKIHIVTFTSHIMSYMSLSEVVISMAGINSFAESLFVNAKVIFLPLSNKEQNRRVRNLQKRFHVSVLEEEELHPESLARVIRIKLSESPVDYDVDLSGKENIAKVISRNENK